MELFFRFRRLKIFTVSDGDGKLPIDSSFQQNETSVPEEYKSLPLVGKCCPVNEVLTKDAAGNSVCVPTNDSSTVYFSPIFSDFNRTGVLVPGDEFKEFVAIVGSSCQYRKYVAVEGCLMHEDLYKDLNDFGSPSRAMLQVLAIRGRCVIKRIDAVLSISSYQYHRNASWSSYSTITLPILCRN